MIFTESTFISFTILVMAIWVTTATVDDVVMQLREHCKDLLTSIDNFKNNEDDYESGKTFLELYKINNILDYHTNIKKENQSLIQQYNETKVINVKNNIMKNIQNIINKKKKKTLHKVSEEASSLVEKLDAIQLGELKKSIALIKLPDMEDMEDAINKLIKKSKEFTDNSPSRKLAASTTSTQLQNTTEFLEFQNKFLEFQKKITKKVGNSINALNSPFMKGELGASKNSINKKEMEEIYGNWTNLSFIAKLHQFVHITSKLVASISKIEKINSKKSRKLEDIVADLAMRYLFYLKRFNDTSETKSKEPATEFCQDYINEDINIFEIIKIEE